MFRFKERLIKARNRKLLRQYQLLVRQIHKKEAEIKNFSDTELKDQSTQFKARIKKGESVDSFIVDAFALVKEASRRTLKMSHFDSQILGGIVLHGGKIAEMQTGEGKTLVATLPAYLNALEDKGVHIVTINDYLAKRDSSWMSPIYEMLGLTVGVLHANMSQAERKHAYAMDITYGTNHEFGFDFLRDHMVAALEEKVQRKLHFAIVDEVDSVLIDESRTPLIISAESQDEDIQWHETINQLIPFFEKGTQVLTALEKTETGDFFIDEKSKQVYLTEQGCEKCEMLLMKHFNIADADALYKDYNVNLIHKTLVALRAHHLYYKNKDYVVKDGVIIIVDEHTGRLMPGRRWSQGLHQAIEAKEKITINTESSTLASITYQHYFKLYHKISGMTGTADTEAFEFKKIYELEVVVIPPNRPVVRHDMMDKVFLSERGKLKAILDDIKVIHQTKQPILVGTTSIENSERISLLLHSYGLEYQVLNAKKHEQEAGIIAEAGRPGAITIATNMAGRGTDIVLGGKADEHHPEESQARYQKVVDSGGLFVIGTERHESRRIDNQLRGRAGRQGDPGCSRFYLSLEDHLIAVFGKERVVQVMKRLNIINEEECIEHPWISKAIENAQKRIEAYYFDIRKNLLEFDSIINEQRKIIYQYRDMILEKEDITEDLSPFWTDVVEEVVKVYCPQKELAEDWKLDDLALFLQEVFAIEIDVASKLASCRLDMLLFVKELRDDMYHFYYQKEMAVNHEMLRQIEKSLFLQILDQLWREQLSRLQFLEKNIHLRGFAQQDPKKEYQKEAFQLFKQLLKQFKSRMISELMQFASKETSSLIFNQKHINRNDLCFCGSNKKFKHCHGRL